MTAKKVVEGRTDKLPKADEFTFNLFSAENLKDPVATAKSKADGTITFENLQVKVRELITTSSKRTLQQQLQALHLIQKPRKLL